MAFIRIKDGKYRQLVESYWDPVRKKHRQRYIRSLGRVDEPYKIEPGETAAFNAIMRDLGKEQETHEVWSQAKFLADTNSPPTIQI